MYDLRPGDRPDREKRIIAFLTHHTYCGHRLPPENMSLVLRSSALQGQL